MARMRRIQVVIDPELDDRLEREAAARRMSKSALVRECVELRLPPEQGDNGLLAVLELSRLTAGVEAVDDIDAYLYGPLEHRS
jgi:hypothetical protein